MATYNVLGQKAEEPSYIPTDINNGSKKSIFNSFLVFSIKGSFGLLRESTFTPNAVLVMTSRL